jgi:hypothetical protein
MCKVVVINCSEGGALEEVKIVGGEGGEGEEGDEGERKGGEDRKKSLKNWGRERKVVQ